MYKKLYLSLSIFLFALLLLSCNKGDNPNQQQDPSQREVITQNLVEFRKGNIPIILSVPHGGSSVNTTFIERSKENCNFDPNFVTGKDNNTIELADIIDQELFSLTKKQPYVIICKAKRLYVDANRPVKYAYPEGSPQQSVYELYYQSIEDAKTEILEQFGKGLLIDIHGHGHTVDQIEIGYKIGKGDLNKNDQGLISSGADLQSSIYYLSQDNRNNQNFAQIIRGPNSLGALFDSYNLPCVPSPKKHSPGSEEYFSGGNIIDTFGSKGGSGSKLDAIQLEFSSDQRSAHAIDKTGAYTARVLKEYVNKNYSFSTNPF